MIKSTKALSMAEAKELVSETDPETKAFIKNFTELTSNQAKEMRDKLMSLDMIKLNEKHISKIIDILPEDKEELGKILNDISLDETETTQVLDTVKQYK
jgi:DNA-directed RNA polymerase subunit F